MGLVGIRIENPGQVAEAWEQALQADQPVVIDALTDPEIVPFSTEVAMKFSQKLASAIQKGDTAASQRLDKPLKEAVQQAAKGA